MSVINSPTKSLIPIIMCPLCGNKMRLSVIMPDNHRRRDHMTFVCDCGFDYRQSMAVEIERTL